MEVNVKELVAIAASVAAGCERCLATHVEAARVAGVTGREIETAINIARAVRLQAIGQIDDVATQLARGNRVELAVVGGDCGCGTGCNC
jgi:AhpD family alkylhydroperoxidase